MAAGVDELINNLYDMIQDAKSFPLSSDKCVLERGKLLDILDDISNRFPGEFEQARTIVESRNELMTNAKTEAETIRKRAEEQARKQVTHEEVYREAVKQSNELLRNTEEKNKELRDAAVAYVNDALRQTEAAILDSLNAVRNVRNQFQNISSPRSTRESPIIEDV